MIKVGIVGTGIIAREHAQALATIPERATLVAAADVSEDRLAAFRDAFHVPRTYGTAEELIADPEIDLVAVATPPVAHERAVVAALEAKKHVLCEKPLAQSLSSAARIMAAEVRNPGRLSVSHQLRYAPQYRRMLWWIQNGWIGSVEEAVVERHGYIPPATYGSGGWWGAWEVSGGGVLITQMIHELDIMLLAMGEPRSANAQMDTRYTTIESEDWLDATLRFDGERSARCAASVNSGQMRGGLTITGSLGSVSPSGLVLKDPARMAKALRAVNAALPDTRQASNSIPARAIRKARRRLGVPERAPLSAHALLYSDIARSVESGTPLPIPGTEAMRSLQVCAAIYEAAIIGHPVEIPLQPGAKTYDGVSKAIYRTRARPAPTARASVPALTRSSLVRVALIGLDTTHATTFTDLLHNPYNPDHIPGSRVVAAFPGGSPDMAISASRVGGFTAELRDKYGVPIVESPEAAADAADVVFILSADGRSHPGLFRCVAGRGKPVFVDKPFAISRADAELILHLARETKTPVFASSAFRYADSLTGALEGIRASGEQIRSCLVRYWGQIQPTQGRFFWYGIHGAEMLTAVMGKGVTAVTARTEGQQDIIEVEHNDGRFSTMVGHHTDGKFQVSIETDRRFLDVDIGGAISARVLASALDVLTPGGYPRLWRASDSGSVSGRAGRKLDPDEGETLEVITLLDAAQRSHASGRRIELEKDGVPR